MKPSKLQIPVSFFNTYYDGSKHPGSLSCSGLEQGANCQYYAYELLRHFGLELPDFRSSDLWEDEVYTCRIESPELLDLVLFNEKDEPYGAHVGVLVGKNLVLHLCKEVGYPTIWNFEEFAKREKYRSYIGAKRVNR